MLAVMNFASEMMAATSSRPSFLIFQFLSSILDTSSDVIFSLEREEEKSEHRRQRRVRSAPLKQLRVPDVCPGQHVHDVLSSCCLFLLLHFAGLLLTHGFPGESDRRRWSLALDLRRHVHNHVRVCPGGRGGLLNSCPTFSNSASI